MRADLGSFSDNFALLTCHSPIKWQYRLFNRFIEGKIPTALDLPTGLGKTSVIAIWLVARALAKKGVLKAIPRRLVYVVDRRAVVDQATEEAEKLRKALEGDAKHLKELLRLDDDTLPISTLRGAHVDNREWLGDPTAPAIIVGTVDMIGSRLLFGGYGVSPKMRPYHAGLLGADTLLVLDEAHLVPPFEALLLSIVERTPEFAPRLDGDREIVPPFKLLSLSATGRARPPATDGGVQEAAFRLEVEDFSDQIVQKRLAAKKAVSFVKIGDEKNELADALARHAWRLSEGASKPVRCLIYCDGRETAERVKEKLDKLALPDKRALEAKADIRTVRRRPTRQGARERKKLAAKSRLPGWFGFTCEARIPDCDVGGRGRRRSRRRSRGLRPRSLGAHGAAPRSRQPTWRR